MKPLFAFFFLLLLLPENAQTQVVLLTIPTENTQLTQEAIISLDLSYWSDISHFQVELWLKDEMVDFVVLPAGTLKYEWQLSKQKAAKQYQIRIVNQKDGNLLAQSAPFTIGKAQLVLGSKIAALAATPITLLASWYLVMRHGVLGPPDPIPVR